MNTNRRRISPEPILAKAAERRHAKMRFITLRTLFEARDQTSQNRCNDSLLSKILCSVTEFRRSVSEDILARWEDEAGVPAERCIFWPQPKGGRRREERDWERRRPAVATDKPQNTMLLASKDPVAEVGRPAGPSVARPPAPMTAKELVAEVGRSAGPSVARPPAPSTSKELVAEVGAWVVLEEVNSGERTKKLLVRENGGLE